MDQPPPPYSQLGTVRSAQVEPQTQMASNPATETASTTTTTTESNQNRNNSTTPNAAQYVPGSAPNLGVGGGGTAMLGGYLHTIPSLNGLASNGSTRSLGSVGAYPAYPLYAGSSSSTPGSRPGEVKLYNSVTERRTFEDLANFYSIIKALDVLECAFTKDAITNTEYETECRKLLAQHKTQESALQRAGAIKDTAGFMMTFKQLHCPHAMNRINEGKPATAALNAEPGAGGRSKHVNSLAAFEAASQVITAKDEIAMDITRVMDIHPLLRDIVDSFSRFEFPGSGKAKIVAWVMRMNSMSATDELSDGDKQQMDFDLQLTYDELHKYLKSKQ